MNIEQVIPIRFFDATNLSVMTISGRGGKEFEIGKNLFPAAMRENRPLYDFVLQQGTTNIRIEIKKQENTQWFDIRKYHNLGDEDRKIRLVFVNHHSKKVDSVAAIILGNFLDLVLSKPELEKFGWTAECITQAYNLTRPDRYPKLQFKEGLRVRDLINAHRDQFQILYESEVAPPPIRKQTRIVLSDEALQMFE